MSHFINWEELEILEKEAKRASKSNGRPWGGARQGAGRPKKRIKRWMKQSLRKYLQK